MTDEREREFDRLTAELKEKIGVLLLETDERVMMSVVLKLHSSMVETITEGEMGSFSRELAWGMSLSLFEQSKALRRFASTKPKKPN